MADNENNENVENTEKKEGKFSGFIKKMGKKIDDAAYDSRLTSDFAKKNVTYRIFTGCGIFAVNPEISVEEHLEKDPFINT